MLEVLAFAEIFELFYETKKEKEKIK